MKLLILMERLEEKNPEHPTPRERKQNYSFLPLGIGIKSDGLLLYLLWVK